ncbi:peptidylprolyl isomerase [Hylemonella gracilis str. Niagara R]|uniref:Periplasmic chaperone PpiD n=1 Tax=Hylemonella gracilis str. Niagara R TaxID=1458275 RepID=A0A016XGI1_9BURK|nr:SurA N-terminal domain-containing protein [Hylemonella gracilis]EYC51199.1 peptidylprolyl isomerase [Hylemonella gracilis str. Niagara R]
MFENLRKHNKILMAVLILLIVPSFVLVGIDGYTRMTQNDRVVARVGKLEITQGEWDAAHRSEADRLRQMMPNLDARLLDSDAVRRGVLERLVRERVLQQAAQEARLGVSDARLFQELQTIPAIAQLRRADNTMDVDTYRELLARQNLTPAAFEAQLRSDLILNQIQSSVSGTAVQAKTAADLALNAWLERREVQLARFTPADYAARVQVSEADLQAYWQANQGLFQAPEQARIEYIVLDIDTLRQEIRVNEQDLRSYYEQNVDRLSGPEERRASHILITAAKDAPAAERQKARAQAQALLDELRKAPANAQAKLFADLARKHSQDPGSASNGGDLGFFGRQAMTPPFEQAVFALKQGELSDVVETDFGYHLITVTGIRKPQAKTYAELRPSLETELRNQQAQARYAEAAEAFTNGVYEQSDSLKPVADQLRLNIQTATVNRDPAQGASDAQGVLTNARLLAAVFSDDAIQAKRNTEAVEISPSRLAAARVVQHLPARTLPLAEVQAAVRERVVSTRAAQLAREDGQAKLAAWKAAPAQAKLGAPEVVSRDQTRNIPRALLDAVLRADLQANGAGAVWVGVDLGEQGYALARVNRRVERAPVGDPAQQNQQRLEYLQRWTQAENEAYYQLLRERLKTRIDLPASAPKV